MKIECVSGWKVRRCMVDDGIKSLLFHENLKNLIENNICSSVMVLEKLRVMSRFG
jgi:hypothetical protein